MYTYIKIRNNEREEIKKHGSNLNKHWNYEVFYYNGLFLFLIHYIIVSSLLRNRLTRYQE